MGVRENKIARENLRNVSIAAAEASVRHKQKAEKAQNVSEETAIRQEIQIYILKKLTLGYPSDELLKRMNFVFGKSKYQPYKKYFATWINSAMEKASKQPRSKENDGEER